MPSAPSFDAIVLAGGRGTRLGGVDKASLVHRGRTLLQHALDAVGDAERIVVVGDRVPPAGVLHTVEDPVGSGPAAAVAAGLRLLATPAPLVAVLACDVPDVGPAFAAVKSIGGPAIAVDRAGRRQLLLALYPGAELLRRCSRPTADVSMKRLVADLDVTEVAVETSDVDDPDDAARFGIEL